MTRTPFMLALCLVAVGCVGTTTSATDLDDAPTPAEPAEDKEVPELKSPEITYKDSTGFFEASHAGRHYGLPASPYLAHGPLPDAVNITVAGTAVRLRVDAVAVPTDGSLKLEAGLLTLCPEPWGGVLLGRRHASDDSWAERPYEAARKHDDDSSLVLYRGICRLQRVEGRADLALRIVGEWPFIANEVIRRRIDLLTESLDITTEE
jgi:hypothetical protein